MTQHERRILDAVVISSGDESGADECASQFGPKSLVKRAKMVKTAFF